MRVALDLTITEVDRAGSAVYARRLADALAGVAPDLELEELRFSNARPGPRTWRRRLVTPLRDVAWTQFLLQRAARRAGVDLLHMPANVGPVHGPVPVVMTIHDLAVLRFPERFNRWFAGYARVVVPRAARAARQIIAPSEATRQDLVELMGLEPEVVHVVPNGVDPVFRPDPEAAAEVRRRYRLPDRFVLTVGSLEPRKNIPRLLRAFDTLAARPAFADVKLVHVGPEGWQNEAVAATLAGLRHRDRTCFLGYIDHADLPAVYGAATVLAYPSLFEGFGLPVLEAMACGTAVVTSNRSSLPEVAGAAGVLVDPESEEAIAEAVARVVEDAELRGTLEVAGIKEASRYSWNATARLTLDVYRAALETSADG